MKMAVERQKDSLKKMQFKRDKLMFDCEITQQMVKF